MSLLSFKKLRSIVFNKTITSNDQNINPASVEVTLGNRFYVEDNEPWVIKANTLATELFTDLGKKQNIKLKLIVLEDDDALVFRPGMFVLAETKEVFNLPDNLVAEYVLKSSQARNGWQHLLAGYCDPGWHNSILTMEFVNESQNGYLLLRPGMKCGQMKFYEVEEVPEDKSYRVVGQYNNQTEVQQAKQLK
jgi:dCTP deaminase